MISQNLEKNRYRSIIWDMSIDRPVVIMLFSGKNKQRRLRGSHIGEQPRSAHSMTVQSTDKHFKLRYVDTLLSSHSKERDASKFQLENGGRVERRH